MRAVDLRCEYRRDPIGIDIVRPRLYWRLEEGARQTAFQIHAGSQSDGDPDVWDSGKVASGETIHIEFGGLPLSAAQRVYWRVRAWDQDGVEGPWSEWAFFEMAVGDWSAQWIGAMLSGGPRTMSPSPYLRRQITLRAKPRLARLSVTALGVYEFRINGSKVGSDLLAPGWTDYNKRVQFQTYDVTDSLAQGENALGAVLGDGWFCGNVEWRGRQLYGDRPKLLAQLEVAYEDGSTERFVTDERWRALYGPILQADILMGEAYDARREMPGWDEAGFDDSGWLSAMRFEEDRNLVAQQGPTGRAIEELRPIAAPRKLDRWPTPDYLFDLGQNMVGHVRLCVQGPAGTTVRLRFGEVLKANGELYTDNLRTALQTDYYTLKGDPEGETWEPRFTFHGFRYVEVRGFPGEPGIDAVTGVVVHSDTPKTGHFECSDEQINQLQRNIDWGQRGNFVDVPTDCPQRDERLGWTGDAQVFIRTAAFNRDVAGFFTKWQQDVRDSQGERGEIPPTCPTTGVVGGDGGPAWADAAIICPWTLYLCYGDERILAEHYDSMRAFLGYLEATHQDYIRCHPDYPHFRGFGDWLSIKADTPQDLIGTAFFAYSAHLLGRIASILGKDDEALRCEALFAKVRDAFKKRYVTADGLVTPQTQTAYLLALHFGLMPEHLRAEATQQLVDDIGRRGWHLSTGFVGSPYINHVLTEMGRTDVAYRLLFQKTWPSWLYPVTQGATTIWERWDGWTEESGFQDITMNSFNHYAYGAVGAWLYQSVAGIDLDPEQPGYRHILLRPHPGEGLTWAKASLMTLHGEVRSSWRLEDGQFLWDVLVPPNTAATAWFPAAEGTLLRNGIPETAKRMEGRLTVHLGPGRHSLSLRDAV